MIKHESLGGGGGLGACPPRKFCKLEVFMSVFTFRVKKKKTGGMAPSALPLLPHYTENGSLGISPLTMWPRARYIKNRPLCSELGFLMDNSKANECGSLE